MNVLMFACVCILVHPKIIMKRFVYFHWPSVRVFANGPGDWGSIPGQVIPKT